VGRADNSGIPALSAAPIGSKPALAQKGSRFI
jgi:hypothetical protein